MKLLGLRIVNYLNTVENKWIPFGKMYSQPNKFKFVDIRYELPKEIQTIYSNTSDINVSGIISNNKNIFDIIYNVIIKFSHNIIQADGIKAYLWYSINNRQFMLYANDSNSIELFEVFPDKEPVYLGNHFNNESIYPKFIGFNDNIDINNYYNIDDLYNNIILISNRADIYSSIPDQQQFIKRLTDKFNNEYKHVHILTLTNSPFILTDLLLDNCTYLDEQYVIQNKEHETFAANLFDILTYNLDLESSISEMSRLFISSICAKKRAGEKINDLIFDYIGDKFFSNSIKYITSDNKQTNN